MTTDTLEAPPAEEVQDVVADADDAAQFAEEKAAKLHKAEQEWIEEIKELEAQCEEAEHASELAAAHAKTAKKIWEAKVDSLRQCIRTGPVVPPDHVQPELPGLNAEQPDEAWKDVAIKEAIPSLTAKQLEKLNDAGIHDVGDFEYCRSGQDKDYPDGLRSIPGVGEATADKWENEVLDWISKQTPIVAGKIEAAE